MIAYMLTWTTYGTWLQGDKRGYVKDGKTYATNPGLYNSNRMALKHLPVYLSEDQRNLVKVQIIEEAERIGQKIYALTIQDRHVHLVAEKTNETIESAVHHYKRTATYVLRQNGFIGKVWTKGYDKRYCLNQGQLKARVEYVLRHDVKIEKRPPQLSCKG